MFSKKTTCLLLTLALIILAVPAFADGNPPPPTGGGNIHPWDNNDGMWPMRGPFVVQSGWMWLGRGLYDVLIFVPRGNVSVPMKSDRSKVDRALRSISDTPRVATQNR
jgi:hypothetical protein